MTDYNYWNDLEQGQVVPLKPGDNPPISTLVQAFQEQGLDAATDAIVLRGYLGRSDIVRRTLNYLERARDSTTKFDNVLDAGKLVAKVDLPTPSAAGPGLATAAPPTPDELDKLKEQLKDSGTENLVIDEVIKTVKELAELAEEHIPWRLYLSPRLDSYVDFHRSSLLAFRRDARTERQDACTVWLRVFEQGNKGIPIPYRVVQETMLGPSFALWLDGAIVDDYAEQGGPGAWGDQSSPFGGGRYPTYKNCGLSGGGRYPTYKNCGA